MTDQLNTLMQQMLPALEAEMRARLWRTGSALLPLTTA